MIEPKKRPGDMALVPAGGVKRPRTELIAAAQSQQLVAVVRKEGDIEIQQGGSSISLVSFRELLTTNVFSLSTSNRKITSIAALISCD